MADSDSTRPPPNTPVQAKYPGRRMPTRSAAEIHEQAMQRAAEPLHLARHHLNPHRVAVPRKDEA